MYNVRSLIFDVNYSSVASACTLMQLWSEIAYWYNDIMGYAYIYMLHSDKHKLEVILPNYFGTLQSFSTKK